MTELPPGFRPFKAGFRGDVGWALAVLVGGAIAAVLFDSWGVLAGMAVGVTVVVVARAIRRRWQRRSSSS